MVRSRQKKIGLFGEDNFLLGCQEKLKYWSAVQRNQDDNLSSDPSGSAKA